MYSDEACVSSAKYDDVHWDLYERAAVDYALTSGYYAETADHTSACVNELGAGYRVADWLQLEALGASSVNSLMNDLGVPTTFNQKHFFVTRDGTNVYSGNRVYFFERHGGHPPGSWLVHATIGDITLGSWYGIAGQVLCMLTAAEGSSTTMSTATVTSTTVTTLTASSTTRTPTTTVTTTGTATSIDITSTSSTSTTASITSPAPLPTPASSTPAPPPTLAPCADDDAQMIEMVKRITA
jgi:hypothetical protein